MKLLKYIFLLILIIIIGGTIYVSLINGDYEIEKETNIITPRALVFKQIENLDKWENWATLTKYSKKESVTHFLSNNTAHINYKIQADNTEIELTNQEITRNSSIVQTALAKHKLGTTSFQINWTLHKQSDTTLVKVHIKAHKNFWAKAMQLIQDKPVQNKINTEVEKSLENLKVKVNEEMSAYAIHVNGVKTTESQNYIFKSISSSNKPDVIQSKRQQILDELKSAAKSSVTLKNSRGFIVFDKIDHKHQNVIISYALPISSNIEVNENDYFQVGNLPEQFVVKATLKGDYQNLPQLWEAVKVYMIDNQLEKNPDASPYEVYLTDSQDSENPADWITELYVPILNNERKPLYYKMQQSLEKVRADSTIKTNDTLSKK